MPYRILFLGHLRNGHTSLERMKAFQQMGHEVLGIEVERFVKLFFRAVEKVLNKFRIYPDFARLNKEILKTVAAQEEKFDLIWIDKGTFMQPHTLQKLRSYLSPKGKMVHFNPDDPFGYFRKGWGLFLKTIPLYDIHFVSRTPNIQEYQAYGAKKVFDYDRSFSKLLHRPLDLNESEKMNYSVDVGFIGAHAPHRAGAIAYLIQKGIPVAVYGNDWENHAFWSVIRPHYRSKARMGEEYVKTLNGMKIALHFLRRENRDEQDSRTFEIPACRVFMIAERSKKHESFFKENEEAVYFDTKEELLEKVKYYQKNPEKAKHIAINGYNRSIQSGYDHHSRLQSLLSLVFDNH